MAKLDWTPSKVMQGHLQNLTNQGFMMAAEHMACHVLEDPAFPAPTDGYVVTVMTFYELEFGAPSHRFLHSLLRYYGVELHSLTSSGVLHIASFMTSYEAYLGLTLSLTYGTISSTSGVCKTQMLS
jgi:hypothetical protein